MTSRRVIFIALFLVLELVVVFGRWADRLILWPSRDDMDTRGLERREVEVGAEHAAIFIAHVEQPVRFVLRLYGNADRAEPNVLDDARTLGPGSEVWGVDYVGYGASTGKATLGGVAASALAAFDAMHAGAKGRPCYIVATSLGTTAALHVAAERQVDGLVLQNPPPLRQLVTGRYGWWNLWLIAWPISLQIPVELDSLGNARRSHATAVFVLSGKDEVVPPPYARRVVDAYAGEKHISFNPDYEHNQPWSAQDRDAIRALLHIAAKL